MESFETVQDTMCVRDFKTANGMESRRLWLEERKVKAWKDASYKLSKIRRIFARQAQDRSNVEA